MLPFPASKATKTMSANNRNQKGTPQVASLVRSDGNGEEDRKLAPTTGNEATKDPSPKRRRLNDKESLHRELPAAAPIKLYCTLSDEVERKKHAADAHHWNRTQCSTLREMLGFDGGTADVPGIEWLLIANYMIDFDYLLDEIPELVSVPRTVVFCGYAETSPQSWKFASGDAFDFVRLDPSQPSGSPENPTMHCIPYGVHHSKIFLVGFSDRIRVIIHTSNLRYSDIHCKTQAAYIQDFSLKSEDELSCSDFEQTLVSYLDTYQYQKRHVWRTGGPEEPLAYLIRRYDFSTSSAVLIPSTPGYHRLDVARQRQLGHLKLRQAVSEYTTDERTAKTGPIICQFSSLGSLTEKYLRELQSSMDTGLARESKRSSTKNTPLRFQFVYPTVEEIRTSVEGYQGGGSVPGTTKNVSKPFLRPLYRRWSTSNNPFGKSRNVPHIKTYYQVHQDGGSLDWFVVTSHNMSRAAWGEVQNSACYGSKRLFIRHWELGAFLSPTLLKAKRLVPWSENGDFDSDDVSVPLPYRLFPVPYQAHDRPWAVDARYSQPDSFSRYSVQDP